MRDSGELYEVHPDAPEIPEGLELVAGLTGFTDAGGAVGQYTRHLAETLEMEPILTFDTDALLDYRARRPVMYFDQDHLSDYRPATLSLSLAKDELGQRFLFLSGFEPDFLWERFASAVVELVQRYSVSSVSWVHAIPMPTPHTRPLGVTVSGNRQHLIDTMSIWRPNTQVPANVLHLIEYRLQEIDHPVAGFVVLVPHYLADADYPLAAVAALENISAATGLIFPTDRLRGDGREFTAKIADQVESNAELSRLVEALEERHDEYMQDNPLPSPLAGSDGELPTAESIAAELERYLANRGEELG